MSLNINLNGGHVVAVHRLGGVGMHYAKCLEFGCAWRRDGLSRRVAVELAETHRRATS